MTTSVAVLVVALVAVLAISLTYRDTRVRQRSFERKEDAWTRERKELLDRIMYLADRPWEMPETPSELVEDDEDPRIDVLQEPIPLDGVIPHYV